MPSQTIEIIARALICLRGRVLVCRNIKHGHIFLPGGHVEPGECSAAALVREIEEELGLPCFVGDLLVVVEAAFTQRGRDHHEINLVFHVELLSLPDSPSPPPLTSREPKIAFDWVREQDIPTSGLLPAPVRDWLHSRLSDPRPSPPSGPGWISDGFSPG